MEHNPYPKDADELSALRRLYPDLSDQELEEARRNLDDYLALAIRIAHRIENDPEAQAKVKEILEEKKKEE